tara:strand:- start:2497 stop:3321 length:825 start_codon:yes stop_codon:yes gene_type:complete
MSPRFIVFLAASLLLSPFVRGEDEGPPAWMKEVTRLPPGGCVNLRPVKLEYNLSWNNRVNAGKFQISIERAGDENENFIGDASGQSSGFARVLWPYDFKARSIVDQSSLRPIFFQLSERDRNTITSYDIIFESERQVYTTTAQSKDESARTNTARFQFDFGQDILSSAFYLRSMPLETGEQISMIVTPFNRPYLANLRVMGKETRKIKGTSYSTIRLDVQIGKINHDLSLKTYDHIKQTSLWVTNDEYRIPLELQSQISVGYISARLVDLEWLE